MNIFGRNDMHTFVAPFHELNEAWWSFWWNFHIHFLLHQRKTVKNYAKKGVKRLLFSLALLEFVCRQDKDDCLWKKYLSCERKPTTAAVATAKKKLMRRELRMLMIREVWWWSSCFFLGLRQQFLPRKFFSHLVTSSGGRYIFLRKRISYVATFFLVISEEICLRSLSFLKNNFFCNEIRKKVESLVRTKTLRTIVDDRVEKLTSMKNVAHTKWRRTRGFWLSEDPFNYYSEISLLPGTWLV